MLVFVCLLILTCLIGLGKGEYLFQSAWRDGEVAGLSGCVAWLSQEVWRSRKKNKFPAADTRHAVLASMKP